MKTCSQCKQAKPESDFAKGQSWCRSCMSAYQKLRRKTPEGKAARQAATDKYRASNRDKVKARRAVSMAILRGTIVKPEFCEKCGGRHPEAHHPDYSKPLEVEWICNHCHVLVHSDGGLDTQEAPVV